MITPHDGRDDPMSSKTPPPTKEERLAKALRENLARRKALVRSKRERAAETTAGPHRANDPARDDTAS